MKTWKRRSTRSRRHAWSICTRSPTARFFPNRASRRWCSVSGEFGPLNLQPHPGRQWAQRGGKHKDPDRERRRRRRATYNRPHGVRQLFAAYDLTTDKVYGHVKPTKTRTKFLEFCRYLRTLYPLEVRLAIVCDNFSPHLTTKKCRRVADLAEANNVEIAYTPTNSSWLNRIEAQLTALRYFALDGTDHTSHNEQASTIRSYIIKQNNRAADQKLREILNKGIGFRISGTMNDRLAATARSRLPE